MGARRGTELGAATRWCADVPCPRSPSSRGLCRRLPTGTYPRLRMAWGPFPLPSTSLAGDGAPSSATGVGLYQLRRRAEPRRRRREVRDVLLRGSSRQRQARPGAWVRTGRGSTAGVRQVVDARGLCAVQRIHHVGRTCRRHTRWHGAATGSGPQLIQREVCAIDRAAPSWGSVRGAAVVVAGQWTTRGEGVVV